MNAAEHDPAADPGEITDLLARWRAGETTALDRLLPALYGELRRLAGAALARGESRTLQPTALVHEAWLKLVAGRPAAARDRDHFLAIAARAMRQVLIDHARERQAQKRGAGQVPEPLEAAFAVGVPDGVDLLALDQALSALAREDALAAQVIELRCFAGLTIDETAALQARHPAAVNRDWAYACAFLRRALGGAAG